MVIAGAVARRLWIIVLVYAAHNIHGGDPERGAVDSFKALF
jgi:hypothetical protein